MAEAFTRPIVRHLTPELQVRLVGAVPNGMIAEYTPRTERLFEQVPWPEKGFLSPPTTPSSLSDLAKNLAFVT